MFKLLAAKTFVSWTTVGVEINIFLSVLDAGLRYHSFRGQSWGVEINIRPSVLDPGLPYYSFRGQPWGWKLIYFQVCLIPACHTIPFVDNRGGIKTFDPRGF